VTEKVEPKKLYLVDGTSNIFRAFYAIRRLTSPAHKPTNATFGFTQMVRKLLQDEKPEYLAVVFDRPEPTHRHKVFPQYKANRLAPPEDLIAQIPDVKRVCQVLGVPVVEMPGYEADDLIGTLALKASGSGCKVIIVSTDKDLLQLVDESIGVLHPVRNELLDPEGVRRSFGVPPGKVVEVLALMGDSSDNVPGVPGIGEKGARDLINLYGSVEGCLEHAAEIPRKSYRESLLRNQDQARMSRDLVRIQSDAPVEWDPASFRRRDPGAEEARRLFAELGFTRLLEEFRAPAGARSAAGREEVSGEGEIRVDLVREPGGLRRAVDAVSGAGRLAVLPVLSSPEPMRATLEGIAFSKEPGHAFYVSLREGDLISSSTLPEGEVLSCIAPLLADPKVRKISPDTKRMLVYLLRRGLLLEGEILDTTLAAYLLDPERRDYSLPVLESTYLLPEGSALPSGREARPGGSAEKTVAELARESERACRILLELEEPLLGRLRQAGLLDLYREMEVPLLSILAEMEWTGVGVDTGLLGEIAAEWNRDLREIEERIYRLAGQRFNINSPQQLREVLFQRLGLAPGRKTEKEKQFSTGMDVLEDLAGSHPLPVALLEYRSLSKLLSTYVEALPRLVNPDTGRVHASFNQAAAATGRLSSSGPNLQNIPVRTERGRQIRRAFVAREGWKIVSADYSQIELRVLAHLSGDPEMIRAFRSGEDIHTRTAAQVFGVAPELVTSDLRRQAKAINFGILYGMGAFRLAKELGVSNGVAQRFIDDYLTRFSAVKRYVDTVVEQAERTGRVLTLFGRVRPVPEIQSRNANVRRQGIRVAVNTTVQGTAADLIKMAMIRLARGIRQRGLAGRLLIQVHDELLLEVPGREVEEVSILVKEAMESVHPLDVPLLAEVRSGPNWLDAS
jgi:DNA polymerase-1